MMSKLIIGCGYLGRRVARRWLDEGFSVAAVTRRVEEARKIEALGASPIVADVTRPETLTGLPAAETLLWAVGYDRASGTSRRAVYVEGLRAVLDAADSSTRRVLLISSTGVYGQTDGSVVDERSPCDPIREGGHLMLAAENVLKSHPLGDRAIILRLAGLYGPDRIPRLADLRAGRPIASASSGYLNLIHVEDAARAVVAADLRAKPPRIYAVSDGHPTTRADFYAFLAELHRLPPPRFTAPRADAGSPTRGDSNKRVDNRRMLDELGVEIQYPSYQDGLRAVASD